MLNIIHTNLAKGYRGGERQTGLLIKALAKWPQISQQLVCRKNSPLLDDINGLNNVKAVYSGHQLQGHLTAGKADIVHAHEARAVHWAWLHQRIYKTPYIITRRIEKPVQNKWLNRQTYTNSAYIVAISKKIQALLDHQQWKQTALIPSVMAEMVADQKITKAFRAQFPGKILVGHIGALEDKDKGQRIIIEAAKRLVDRKPEFHFLLFGNGSDKKQLHKESEGLSNISWMGFKNNIFDYIKAFDLFVFPSRNEGLGSTLLDIMQAEVPIIASDAGGITDIVHHNQTGIILPENTGEQLAKAITTLYQDKEKMNMLCNQAKKQLGQYTPAVMAESYQAIYKQVCTNTL